MYNKTYIDFCNKVTRFYEKVQAKYPASITHKQISSIELLIQLQSEIHNRKLLLIMLIVLEKITQQRTYFLFDRNTLSKNRIFKIGCRVLLRNENVHYFLDMAILHSLHKIINNEKIYFNKNNPITKYQLKKILFFSIFSYDADFNHYSDYYDEANYEFNIKLTSVYHSAYINKLILSNHGFNYMK